MRMWFILSLIIFFFAIIIHEFSHAFIAYRLGDSTAKRMGRLTLNPLAHIDPVGTILLPLFLIIMSSLTNRPPIIFGWAKPVPINFAGLRNPKKDIIWVGLAGPAANLLCATVFATFLNIGLLGGEFASAFFLYLIIINVVLAAFNLIPIPPLDGSRILIGLLPPPLAMRYAQLEPYGFIILIALLYMGLFQRIVWPFVMLILSFLGITP